MLTFKDGPIKGAYACRRAPVFLRGVHNPSLDNKDVLDQSNDTPSSRELVYVYIRDLSQAPGTATLRTTKGCGVYPVATYYYLPDVEGSHLRDNQKWRKWCIEHGPERWNLQPHIKEE